MKGKRAFEELIEKLIVVAGLSGLNVWLSVSFVQWPAAMSVNV